MKKLLVVMCVGVLLSGQCFGAFALAESPGKQANTQSEVSNTQLRKGLRNYIGQGQEASDMFKFINDRVPASQNNHHARELIRLFCADDSKRDELWRTHVLAKEFWGIDPKSFPSLEKAGDTASMKERALKIFLQKVLRVASTDDGAFKDAQVLNQFAPVAVALTSGRSPSGRSARRDTPGAPHVLTPHVAGGASGAPASVPGTALAPHSPVATPVAQYPHTPASTAPVAAPGTVVAPAPVAGGDASGAPHASGDGSVVGGGSGAPAPVAAPLVVTPTLVDHVSHSPQASNLGGSVAAPAHGTAPAVTPVVGGDASGVLRTSALGGSGVVGSDPVATDPVAAPGTALAPHALHAPSAVHTPTGGGRRGGGSGDSAPVVAPAPAPSVASAPAPSVASAPAPSVASAPKTPLTFLQKGGIGVGAVGTGIAAGSLLYTLVQSLKTKERRRLMRIALDRVFGGSLDPLSKREEKIIRSLYRDLGIGAGGVALGALGAGAGVYAYRHTSTATAA